MWRYKINRNNFLSQELKKFQKKFTTFMGYKWFHVVLKMKIYKTHKDDDEGVLHNALSHAPSERDV